MRGGEQYHDGKCEHNDGMCGQQWLRQANVVIRCAGARAGEVEGTRIGKAHRRPRDMAAILPLSTWCNPPPPPRCMGRERGALPLRGGGLLRWLARRPPPPRRGCRRPKWYWPPPRRGPRRRVGSCARAYDMAEQRKGTRSMKMIGRGAVERRSGKGSKIEARERERRWGIMTSRERPGPHRQEIVSDT